jgi:putative hydrolases of HD superfamily
MNAKGILEFIRVAGRLKRTRRTGWVEAGVSDPESVADHTYRVALLSMALADSWGLDSHRAVGMALLHDLAEAVTGDLTPEQKPPDHAAYESEAFRQVVGGLDPDQRSRYTELFLEYVAGETPEAVLVHAADKLDMAIQAHDYIEEGAHDSNLGRFMEVDLPEEYGALLSALKELGPS